ncbi:glycosyltransferase [Dyadobacter sp. CY312]|uniref:glycosyltransferase n=1 Tax=Dyadobacter sp. CY312 TaxID=2907303 RepID=UPI001F38F631|nr:glycosyltransferase [Dyadobacter sp. CY312]MCE7041484.1 glycosyltransferase [Dyadobacter sp. CY312]
MLEIVWIAAQLLIGFQLVFPLLLLFIRGITRRTRTHIADEASPDYAVIVTAYEQTDQLPEVVQSILTSHYKNFIIYVVADNCDVSNLHFASDQVVLLRPPTVLAGNVRSHFYAINHFIRPHSHLTIIDSDNLVVPDYLTELNVFFRQGFKAVQGVRKAKNMETMLARLDAARDIYYHYYDGRMLFEAGSSATLAGSGMAFTTELYKQCLENLNVSGAGFDKVLQHQIVRRGNRIAFAERAVVYDEKTSGSEQLVNQRARWINTWFKYFSLGFGLIGAGIIRFDWNRFLFGIVLLRPPLFIFLALSVLFMFLDLWIAPLVSLAWIAGLFAFVTGFFIALLNSDTDPEIYSSLQKIPQFISLQMRSLFKANRANKISVATKHNVRKTETDKL